MRPIHFVSTFAAAVFVLASHHALAEETKPEAPQYKFQNGPKSIELGNAITIALPEGYSFLDGDEARKAMEFMGNRPDPATRGLVVKDGSDWYIFYEFADEGYIRDDDAADLDPDNILKSIREATEAANEYRREHGAAPFNVDGWAEVPSYDKTTHHVDWAVLGSSTDGKTVNAFTRVLGRKGYIRMTLVTMPEALAASRAEAALIFGGTTFDEGSRYADFKEGEDKVAEYGLAALIAGGAGAAALKVGIFAKLGKILIGVLIASKKLIVVALVGGVALVKSFFGGKNSNDKNA
jgi:uncharacterized membrane-anchored protein